MKHVALQSKIAPQFQDSAERCGSVERNYFCPKLSKWPEDAKDAKEAFLRQKEMAKRVFSGGEWKVATGKNSKKRDEYNSVQFQMRSSVCWHEEMQADRRQGDLQAGISGRWVLSGGDRCQWHVRGSIKRCISSDVWLQSLKIKEAIRKNLSTDAGDKNRPFSNRREHSKTTRRTHVALSDFLTRSSCDYSWTAHRYHRLISGCFRWIIGTPMIATLDQWS